MTAEAITAVRADLRDALMPFRAPVTGGERWRKRLCTEQIRSAAPLGTDRGFTEEVPPSSRAVKGEV